MRVVLFVLGLAVQSLLFSASFGCGGRAVADFTTAFFPLNVGDIRVYRRGGADFTQTVEAETTVAGRAALPFVTRNAGGETVRTDFYGTGTEDGIEYLGFDDLENDLSERYDPPVLFPALLPGGSRTETVQVEGGGGFASVETLTYTVTFQAFEICVVPAGSFPDCAKFTTEVVHKDAGGNVVEDGTFTQFLVQDVGGVRLSHEGLSIPGVTSELVSATVGGRSIP